MHSSNFPDREALPAFQIVEIDEPISVLLGTYGSAVELRNLLQDIPRPDHRSLTLLVAMNDLVRASDLPGLAGEIGPIDRLVLTEGCVSNTERRAPRKLDRIGEALGSRQTVYENDHRRGVLGAMQILRASNSFVAILPSTTSAARALIDAGMQWRASFESAEGDGYFSLPACGH